MMKRASLLLVLLGGAACGETTYEFQPVQVGSDGDSTRDPRPRSNSQFVRAVYTDLVGRTPESYDFVITTQVGEEVVRFPIDEEAYLLFVLDGVGDPAPLRNLIATGLVDSPEVALPEKGDVDAAEFVTDQFRKLLGRDPNPYELDAFVSEWETDAAVGPRTVVRAIVGSREYQSY